MDHRCIAVVLFFVLAAGCATSRPLGASIKLAADEHKWETAGALLAELEESGNDDAVVRDLRAYVHGRHAMDAYLRGFRGQARILALMALEDDPRQPDAEIVLARLKPSPPQPPPAEPTPPAPDPQAAPAAAPPTDGTTAPVSSPAGDESAAAPAPPRPTPPAPGADSPPEPESIQVARAIARVLNAQHAELPRLTAIAKRTRGAPSVQLVNRTDAPLTVLHAGEGFANRIVIPARKSATLDLPPGDYNVAAEVLGPPPTTFAGHRRYERDVDYAMVFSVVTFPHTIGRGRGAGDHG